MTLPVHFATLQGGPQPLSLLDRQFHAIGNLTTIPCDYSSPDGNAITLTPSDNTPSLFRYTNLAPQFIFQASLTNTGPVTINIMGVQSDWTWEEASMLGPGSQQPSSGWPTPPPLVPLGARPAFKDGGLTAIAAGDIVIGAIYVATFSQSINSGSGGFVVTPYGAFWPAQTWSPAVTSQNGPYGAVAVDAEWWQIGQLVFFNLIAIVSSKGSGSGFMSFPSPPPPVSSYGIGSGRQQGGPFGFVEVAQGACQYFNFDESDPVPTGGGTIVLNAWYPSF